MKKRYRIGEIAKIKNIDTQTLRFYDAKGVLSPQIVDKQTGYRYYTIDQFIEVDRIRFYKLLGLSLEEIKTMSQIHDVDEAIDTLQTQKNAFDAQIAHMQTVSENIGRILDTISQTRTYLESGGAPIHIAQCEAITGIIGDCRTVNDWYAFNEKLSDLSTHSEDRAQALHHYGISFIYNRGFLQQPDQSNLEKIIIPISQNRSTSDTTQSYPLGKSIVAYHHGPRSTFPKTLAKIQTYIDENNLRLRGEIITNSIISGFIVNTPDAFLIRMTLPLAAQ